MTISTTDDPRSGPYEGNDSQDEFPIDFRIFTAAQLLVVLADAEGVETTLVLGSDYSVAINADQDANPGGTLTYPISGTPLPTGETLTIVSDLDFTQPVDINNGSGFYPAVIEGALDRVTMLTKQMNGTLSRALQLAVSTPDGVDTTLPSPVASNIIGWDADGVSLANYPPDTSTSTAELENRLADPTSTSNGDALIGVKRTDIAAAVGLTLHDWNNRARVNVRQVGVTGDGATDDSTLLNTLGALGIPLYIPYTSTGYRIASTVTFNCDVYCDGFFTPTTAIGGAANDYDRFAIVLAAGGYPDKRQYTGIKVTGSVPLRAANVSGIRVDCPASTLNSCTAQQLNYGIVVRNYSVTLNKCSAFQCNTNLSAYARDNAHEINVLVVWGGNYDSAVNCAANIGDLSWSDAMPYGTGQHGVNIFIGGGAAFDASEVRVDGINGFKADNVYFEGSNTGIAWRLGGAGDNLLRDVEIGKCFYNSLQWAVKCFSGINGLTVRRSFYTAVTRSAVHIVNNNYPLWYERGVSVGSFTQGQELYTGFGNIAIGSITFDHVSADFLGLNAGVQIVKTDMGQWFGGGKLTDSTPTVKTMNASASGRFLTAPALAKAGTVASNVFTFTTLADCYAFNGGDRITTVPAGATVIRSIDYTTGVATLGAGTTANGAATISQQAPTFLSETTTYSGAAPASGTWSQGDHAINGVVTVGTPKGWRCTVGGTPGTWVNEGNL